MAPPALTRLKSPPHAGHRVAFVVVATTLLFTAALLPFAIGGVFGDIWDPPSDQIYRITTPPQPADPHIRIHLNILSLDQNARTVSLRASGHQACAGECPGQFRLMLVSNLAEGPDAEGLPPSVTISVPAGAREVNQLVTLPVHGDAIRYPFDRYRFDFGVVLQSVQADGSIRTLPPADGRSRLFITLQTQVQATTMSAPATTDAAFVRDLREEYPLVVATHVLFERPLYLRVLTVLLVLLVTAAAAYAVFMRPLDQLVTNVGALVLGIWGVRAILVGTNAAPGTSALDLSLSVVILFLLAAITARALSFLDERSEIRLLRRLYGRLRPSPHGEAGPDSDTPPAAGPPSTGARP